MIMLLLLTFTWLFSSAVSTFTYSQCSAMCQETQQQAKGLPSGWNGDDAGANSQWMILPMMIFTVCSSQVTAFLFIPFPMYIYFSILRSSSSLSLGVARSCRHLIVMLIISPWNVCACSYMGGGYRVNTFFLLWIECFLKGSLALWSPFFLTGLSARERDRVKMATAG